MRLRLYFFLLLVLTLTAFQCDFGTLKKFGWDTETLNEPAAPVNDEPTVGGKARVNPATPPAGTTPPTGTTPPPDDNGPPGGQPPPPPPADTNNGGAANTAAPRGVRSPWNTILPYDHQFTTAAFDAQGNIWLGTKAGGLIKYNETTKQAIVYRQSTSRITSDHVTAIGFDAQNIYVGTEKGLNILTGTRWSAPTELAHPVRGIGDKYVATEEALWHFAADGWKKVDGPTGMTDKITAFANKGGVLWLGTEKGLWKKDATGWSEVTDVKHPVTAIAFTGDDWIWVGTKGKGLYVFNKTVWKDILAQHDITQMAVHGNQLWVIGDHKIFLRRDQDTDIFVPRYISSAQWSALAIQEARGEILFAGATNIAGVLKKDSTAALADDGATKIPLTGLVSKQILKLALRNKDNKSELWIGTDKGLQRYDYESKSINATYVATPGQLDDNHIDELGVTQDGEVWVVDHGNSAKHFDPDSTAAHWTVLSRHHTTMARHFGAILATNNNNAYIIAITYNYSYPAIGIFNASSKRIQKIQFATAGNITAIGFVGPHQWYATSKKGIYVYDGLTENSAFRRVIEVALHDRHPAINVMRSDKHDAPEHVWVGSNGKGVTRIDMLQLINHPEGAASVHGLEGKTVKAIAVDKAKNAWFATIDGLESFNGTEWKSYVVDPSLPRGLKSNHINDLLYDATNDILWIATNDGLTSLQPSLLAK